MNNTINLLEGLVIIDMATGMAPALISKFLTDNGARVIKVLNENEQYFYDYYPAYSVWYNKAEISNISKTDTVAMAQLFSQADACIVGGESSPDINSSDETESLSEQHPELVILKISGNPHGSSDSSRPSTDILAQARTGLCYEHYSDRPIVMSFEPANYGAAFQGLCGLLAALYEKELSDKGQVVHTSLFEGALTWVMQLWGDYEKPNSNTLTQPMDLHPLIFQCADGVWVHIVLGSAGSKYKLYQILGIDDPTIKPGDSGMPDLANPNRRNFFGDIDLLTKYVSKFQSKPLLEAMSSQGLAAEIVLQPGECWQTPQVKHNAIITEEEKGVRYVGNPIIALNHKANAEKKTSTSNKPLSGLRIVDFGAYVAGPLASKILSDFGADVIKVEPLKGDPARAMMMSYAAVNKGKKGLALNLKTGMGVVKKLVKNADIVTNNFRSGVSQRLGIDPTSLHKLKDDLIVLESPGYGTSGPLAKQAAFDLVMQAVCGHEAKGGGEGNTPFWNRTYMVDFAGGFLGAISLLTALIYRTKTGNGSSIDVPLLNAGIFLLSEIIQMPDGEFNGARQLNSTQTGYSPDEAMYQAKDGWIAIVARNSKQKKAMADLLALPDLFKSTDKSAQTQDFTAIGSALAKYTTKDIVNQLDAVGVWVEPCRQQAKTEIFNDPFYEEKGIVQTGLHPTYGKIKDMGTLVSFSRSHTGSEIPIHQLGEHTTLVLKEAGFTDEEISIFKNSNIVN